MPEKRILVVDDEYLPRSSLADFLNEMDYETATATDSDAAVQLQKEKPFDVCIVDVRMPGKGGVETILALHRIALHSRFIVYTGSPQFTLPSSLLELGLTENDIVRKPVLDMNIFLPLIDLKTSSAKGPAFDE